MRMTYSILPGWLSLLDQRLPDDLNWMFNSASDINNFIPALISAIHLLSWRQQFDSCTDVGYFISARVFRRPLFLSPTSTGPRTSGWMFNPSSTFLQLFLFLQLTAQRKLRPKLSLKLPFWNWSIFSSSHLLTVSVPWFHWHPSFLSGIKTNLSSFRKLFH